MELKMATVAYIRAIPSQNNDSELCDVDVANNCSGSISISETNDEEENVTLVHLQRKVENDTEEFRNPERCSSSCFSWK